jgi:hypothetical protein
MKALLIILEAITALMAIGGSINDHEPSANAAPPKFYDGIN